MKLRKDSTILTQFYREGRTKMTRSIANALFQTFRYYLTYKDAQYSKDDIRKKAIMFVYVVSSVDLSYMYYSIETNEKLILDTVKSIFHIFVKKESIKKTEIQNLAYTTAFGYIWYVQPGELKITNTNYLNILQTHNQYNIMIYQSEHGTEKTISKYDNCYEVPEENELKEYYDKIYKLVDSFNFKIRDFFEFIRELLIAKSFDEYKGKHTNLKQKFTGKDIIKCTTWKNQILMSKYSLFKLKNDMDELLYAIINTNIYLAYSIYAKYIRDRLIEFSNRKIFSKSEENKKLLDSHPYKSVMNRLQDIICYIDLQTRINSNLGTFGSCSIRMEFFKSKEANNFRELIRLMVNFLFYGVQTKKGIEDSCNKGLNEIRSDIILKYNKGEQKNFSYNLYQALKFRIEFYMYPERRMNGIYSRVTSYQFCDFIWLFFCYSFGIDFYMLRLETAEEEIKKEYWFVLLGVVFNHIRGGEEEKKNEGIKRDEEANKEEIDKKYIENMRSKLNDFFVMLQIKMEGKYISRFTPDEINFFRNQDVFGYEEYLKLQKKYQTEVKKFETN